jgi:hypothetical protein
MFGTLTAADPGTRVLTYLLLPYGETGRTSLGACQVAQGVLTLPDAPESMVLNMEHEPTHPVGRGTSLTDTPTGLVASFAIANTTRGNDLLEEAAAGLRTGVSVELADATIRAGHLTAGRLTGAGAVVAPAFVSAQLVAADTPDPDTDPVPDTTEDAPADPAQPEGDPVETTETLTAAAPLGLPAVSTTPEPLTLSAVNRLLAAAGGGRRDRELMAALADIVPGDMTEMSQPSWLGEVWAGNTYQRRIVPLLQSRPLTGLTAIGWQWDTAPVGDDYAGDKAAVPSAVASTKAVNVTAARWAGAHDVDRAMRDFPNPEFWDAYWAAMAASYAKWTDALAITALDAVVANATAADGIGIGVAIADACLDVLDAGGVPNLVLVDRAAFRVGATAEPLAFLSGALDLGNGSGGIGSVTLKVVAGLTDGTTASDGVVVALDTNAVTFRELGGTPIRVEGVDLVNGGVDVGAFGYAAINVNSAAHVAKRAVDAAAAVTP